MKAPLTLLFTTITFLGRAQQTLNDGTGSAFSMSCMFVLLFISLLIACIVYLLVNNKRRSINENKNSETNL